jgi:hypothetical protein
MPRLYIAHQKLPKQFAAGVEGDKWVHKTFPFINSSKQIGEFVTAK